MYRQIKEMYSRIDYMVNEIKSAGCKDVVGTNDPKVHKK